MRGRVHQTGKVLRRDVGRHVGALKLGVDGVLRGVAFGIGTNPSVVLNGSVQRLRAVCHVVTEPPGVQHDCMLHRTCRLVRLLQNPVLTKRRLQAAEHFQGYVGLKANALGQVVIWMVGDGGALFVKPAVELVAIARQGIEPGDSLQVASCRANMLEKLFP